jgi:hypothetical protein
MEIPFVPGSIFTHQSDVTEESQSAFFIEWNVPLEGVEADEWLSEEQEEAIERVVDPR